VSATLQQRTPVHTKIARRAMSLKGSLTKSKEEIEPVTIINGDSPSLQAAKRAMEESVQVEDDSYIEPAEDSVVKKTTSNAPIKPLDITVPGEIDRYTIGKRIGSGTCGVVHQALDNLLGREVAVKLSPIGEAHISTGKVPGAQRAYQTEIVAERIPISSPCMTLDSSKILTIWSWKW